MISKRIAIFILFTAVASTAFAQRSKKPAPTEGALYFSLTGQKKGKKITIAKETGRIIEEDSLKMVNRITAYYKVGQKVSNVKDILYDNYFLSTLREDPTILQGMQGLAFDTTIWVSCIDSLTKKDQVVFIINEITLDDGTKIEHPKLAKENKAVYKVYSNPDFPPGGWQTKAKRWIDMWKGWFKPTDPYYYMLTDKVLDLYAYGIVYTIKKKPEAKK